ncbi:MAG: hypothetical protein H0W90_01900 [Actinobacteria bacterium]|nr:hypothetical protein [Actinomycetota bacterium]
MARWKRPCAVPCDVIAIAAGATAWEDPTPGGLRAHQLAANARNAGPFPHAEAAEAELREILQDEPDWRDVLPVELDERNVSAN